MKAHLLTILSLLCIVFLILGVIYYPIETVIVFVQLVFFGCFYWMLYYFSKEN